MSEYSLTYAGGMPPRAKPLPPDERRRALVEVTVPLLIEHGRSVTSRQIADAAGVAEGTIFRAFGSKDELVDHLWGTDFDGFIKPSMGGLQDMSGLRSLEEGLRQRYGDEIAEQVTWKNPLRVLETLWPDAGEAGPAPA